MTKENRSKILTAVVVVVLCAIFVGGFAIGLNSVLAMEGSYPPNVLVESNIAAPEKTEDADKILDDAISYAVSEAPKIEANRELDISHDGSSFTDYLVETDGSDQFTDTVKYIMSEIDNDNSSLYKTLLGKYESKTANFGEGIENVLQSPDFTASDIKDFELNYIYYHCSSCGEDSDEPLENCELCGSDLPYQKKYKDEYTVNLYFDSENETVLKKNFSPVSNDEAKDMFAAALGDDIKVNNVSLSYPEFSVTYKVKRLTNEITYLCYTSKTDVDADVEMTGKYNALGQHNIKFTIEKNDKFKFTWPSLVLSDDIISVEPKGNDNLLATLTCDEPTKQIVTWTSSDENVVTVDEEGYFKAGKEAGTAVITASFDYNGKTYSDTCDIEVKYSVESMKMLKKNVKLDIGESYTLETKVSPKKSTIKTVKWYTEDESIATVDAAGNVKAVGSGVVTVYALSDDGYFKSSCEVTVR